MDLQEIEAKAQESPNPLEVTKEDVELSTTIELKADVQVRNRRLSQLETYIKNIEEQTKGTDKGLDPF